MITGNNHYYNRPAVQALEALSCTGVPEDMTAQILDASPQDDLSGLRLMATRIREADYWRDEVDLTQPKAEIGDYVEAAGLTLPRRYESLDEAMHAVGRGESVIARSEHPDEYDGASGLMRSVMLNEYTLTNPYGEFADKLAEGWSVADVLASIQTDGLKSLPMLRYVDIRRMPQADYWNAASYSYWQAIPGRNITVVADDAVAGRYHVMVVGRDKNGALSGRSEGHVVDASGNQVSAHEEPKVLVQPEIASVIDQYDAVRQLPAFSTNECPVMEWQLDAEGNLYFLQYHKGRSSSATPDVLPLADYPASEGWFKALGVRGALGACVTLNTALWYPKGYADYRSDYGGSKSDRQLPGIEDASFDFHYDFGLTEVLSRQRTAYISTNDTEFLYAGMAIGHDNRSRWFNPMVSLGIGRAVFTELIPKQMSDYVSRRVHMDHGMMRIALDIASDGRNGFVRLNPDTDSPVGTWQ